MTKSPRVQPEIQQPLSEHGLNHLKDNFSGECGHLFAFSLEPCVPKAHLSLPEHGKYGYRRKSPTKDTGASAEQGQNGYPLKEYFCGESDRVLCF